MRHRAVAPAPTHITQGLSSPCPGRQVVSPGGRDLTGRYGNGPIFTCPVTVDNVFDEPTVTAATTAANNTTAYAESTSPTPRRRCWSTVHLRSREEHSCIRAAPSGQFRLRLIGGAGLIRPWRGEREQWTTGRAKALGSSPQARGAD